MPHDGVIGPHAHASDHDHADHDAPGAGPSHATTRRRLLATGAGLLVSAHAVPVAAQVGERISRAALDWLASLDQSQRQRAVIAFADSERENWHYVPRSRRGLALREMSEGQRTRVAALLESALGSNGVARVQGVRRLEEVLRQRQGAWRDPDNYALAIFGTPGAYPWGWRFEGHHLSLNLALLSPERIAVTPAFWGAHPAQAPDGFRLRGEVEQLGRDLVRSLPDAQRQAAIIGARSLGDIVAGPGRERELGTPRGLSFVRMDTSARNRALAIVERFLEGLAPDIAASQRRRVHEVGIESLHFAWAGPLEDGQAHYFRLHGTVTLIELDNTQNDANHIHSVWRDLPGDFGHDALADHYRLRRHR
jgi:hypothetical protein